jgi:hypothetical protein
MHCEYAQFYSIKEIQWNRYEHMVNWLYWTLVCVSVLWIFQFRLRICLRHRTILILFFIFNFDQMIKRNKNPLFFGLEQFLSLWTFIKHEQYKIITNIYLVNKMSKVCFHKLKINSLWKSCKSYLTHLLAPASQILWTFNFHTQK